MKSAIVHLLHQSENLGVGKDNGDLGPMICPYKEPAEALYIHELKAGAPFPVVTRFVGREVHFPLVKKTWCIPISMGCLIALLTRRFAVVARQSELRCLLQLGKADDIVHLLQFSV